MVKLMFPKKFFMHFCFAYQGRERKNRAPRYQTWDSGLLNIREVIVRFLFFYREFRLRARLPLGFAEDGRLRLRVHQYPLRKLMIMFMKR